MQTISDANVDQGTDWKNPRIFSEIRQNLHILTKIDENPAFLPPFCIFLRILRNFDHPSAQKKSAMETENFTHSHSANFAVLTRI